MSYIDETYGKQLEEALRGLVSRPALGQPWFGFHASEVPAGVLLFTATTHSRVLYADFWKYIQDKNLVKTEEEWQSIYSEQGWCPFYSDGDGIDTFRMPSAPLYLHGANKSDAGSYQSAGLPGHTHTRGSMNITGDVGLGIGSNGYHYFSGAFSSSKQSYAYAPYSDNKQQYIVDFDASRSWTGETSEPTNPIYGNSDTVTPETSKMLFGVWAISASQKPIPDATVEGIISELGVASNNALEAKNGLNGVVRSVNSVAADATGGVSDITMFTMLSNIACIRFTNGLQICWGGQDMTSSTEVTFPAAFTGPPTITTSIYSAGNNVYFATFGGTATKFGVDIVKIAQGGSIAVVQGDAPFISWSAFGRWK